MPVPLTPSWQHLASDTFLPHSGKPELQTSTLRVPMSRLENIGVLSHASQEPGIQRPGVYQSSRWGKGITSLPKCVPARRLPLCPSPLRRFGGEGDRHDTSSAVRVLLTSPVGRGAPCSQRTAEHPPLSPVGSPGRSSPSPPLHAARAEMRWDWKPEWSLRRVHDAVRESGL